MNRQSVFKWFAIALVVLTLVAVVGGGIVYATTSVSRTDEAPSEASNEVAEVVGVDKDDDGSEPGIVITSVDDEGPAAAAGVVRGDILLEIDGEPVDNMPELHERLEYLEVGTAIELKVLHGDDERTLTATLGERNSRPYLGVVSCGGNQELMGFMGELLEPGQLPHVEGLQVLPEAPGAMISRVVPSSPADEAGLVEGDRIAAINGQELDAENDLADLIAEHEPGDTVVLSVERPGEEDSLEVTVELGEHPEKEGVAYLGVEYLPVPHVNIIQGQGLDLDEFPLEIPHFRGEPFLLPPEAQQGAVVRKVADDSPAAEVGLSEGDLITAINGEVVDGPRDVVDAMADREPGDVVTLTVFTPGDEEERQVEVTLAENPEEEGKAFLGVTIGGFNFWGPSDEGIAPHGVLPLDLEDLPFNFDFEFGPEQFEEELLQPEQDTV